MRQVTKSKINSCLIIFFIGLSFTTNLLSQTKSLLQKDFSKTADNYLEASIDQKIFTGLVGGISIEGEKAWMTAKGYSNKKEGKAMEVQTITRTASIAKSMTAIAVMQLFEQGLIDLDAPIQTYIPGYPIKKEGDMTIRQLLSHTAGIPAYASGKEAQTQTNYANLAEAMEVFKNRDLLFTPGTQFSYSTYGYVVLGHLIEKVSGVSYEEYMIKNIWEKAGMAHTGVEKYQSTYANKSSLYHRNKRGKITLAKNENNLSNRIPGGGFYSCLEDLLRFGEAVLNNELIHEETLQLMLEKQGVEKEGNPYGLGWFMYGGQPDPAAAFGHSGEQTGVSAQLMIVPKGKRVIVVLSNTSGSWEEAIQLSAQLIQLSNNEEVISKR